MALVISNQQVFWIEWENLDPKVVEHSLIVLQSKVMDSSKFEITKFKTYSNLKARVTTEDCTPIRNLVFDVVRESENL